MAISKKLGETDVSDAVMYILLENGSITTSEVKKKAREMLEPEGTNRTPLLNRNDEAIDQIIRNIVSHRFDSKKNIINKGYVDYDKGSWTLTDLGKKYLHQNVKGLFKNELADD